MDGRRAESGFTMSIFSVFPQTLGVISLDFGPNKTSEDILRTFRRLLILFGLSNKNKYQQTDEKTKLGLKIGRMHL